MIRSLYEKYANYYDITHNDRDFLNQSRLMIDLIGAPEGYRMNVLDLFSGPSYHSAGFLEQGFLVNMWAVDRSQQMKKIAVDKGHIDEEKYLIGELPGCVSNLQKDIEFDMIICMSFSLGCLDRKNVYALLKQLKGRLAKNGKILIELHNIGDVIGSMKKTDIRKRASFDQGKQICCEWPHGEINWSNDDFIASMKVKVWNSDHKEELMFTSIEHIYSINEISFFAQLLGYKCILPKKLKGYRKNEWNTYFKDSNIIILQN